MLTPEWKPGRTARGPAFPQLSPLSGEAADSLKTVQSALGSWHDHFQWCLKARHEKDLQPLAQMRHTAAETALLKAEAQLAQLLRLLRVSVSKKCFCHE